MSDLEIRAIDNRKHRVVIKMLKLCVGVVMDGLLLNLRASFLTNFIVSYIQTISTPFCQPFGLNIIIRTTNEYLAGQQQRVTFRPTGVGFPVTVKKERSNSIAGVVVRNSAQNLHCRCQSNPAVTFYRCRFRCHYVCGNLVVVEPCHRQCSRHRSGFLP